LDGSKLSEDDDDGEEILTNKIGRRILTTIEVKNERSRKRQRVVKE
jgi:hypothetical protein